MKVIDQIENYRKASTHPLTVNGQNVLELSKQNPAAAYELVWKDIESRGGFEAPKRFFARQSCIRQAMAKPLPGAAGDAFLKGAVTVGDYCIYEVMPIHLKCLQLVNSPMLDLMTSAVQDGASAKREFECDDEFQLCYIFTENPEVLYDTPKPKLAQLIQDSAKAKFRAANSATVNGICAAIVKQFERHIATTVRFAGEVEGQTEKKNSPA